MLNCGGVTVSPNMWIPLGGVSLDKALLYYSFYRLCWFRQPFLMRCWRWHTNSWQTLSGYWWSAMNWLWKASSSSLWQWKKRSGSLTLSVTSMIPSLSHRLSSSATPSGRSVTCSPTIPLTQAGRGGGGGFLPLYTCYLVSVTNVFVL